MRCTKDDATRIRFCYAKSNNENGKSLDFLKTCGNEGKQASYIDLRGLRDEAVAYVEKMIKPME